MLPGIILIALQLLGAFYIAPWIKAVLPFTLPRVAGYDLDIFLWALVFAVVVYLIGWMGSLVLKGLRTPSSVAFWIALILAVILAGLTQVPQVTQAVAGTGVRISNFWWPMVGAMVGYYLRR